MLNGSPTPALLPLRCLCQYRDFRGTTHTGRLVRYAAVLGTSALTAHIALDSGGYVAVPAWVVTPVAAIEAACVEVVS